MIDDFRTVIEARRDGRAHTREELDALATGAGKGTVPDYQLAAWLMAAYLNPLTKQETTMLTPAMAESGERVDLSGLPKPWVDKHSTGGVGDKTSIVLLPLLASCGLTVVKMSGAGLGMTGGTVDKLSSIPGLRLDLSVEELKAQARRIGVALTGQTPDLAPADKALYALRDVTATVRSIPLIVSSILSKKLAGGAEVVALDVKCGSGAFMKTLSEARELAEWLKEIGDACGLTVRPTITDMSQPLGSAVGNALEVAEALHVLMRPAEELSAPVKRFRELCVELAGETLGSREKAGEALSSGRAAAKAAEWIAAQGGPPTLEAVLQALPKAPVGMKVLAPSSGWIERIDAGAVGETVVELGGGRRRKGDAIDLSVGLEILAGVGARVERDQPIAVAHARSDADARRAEIGVLGAFGISTTPVTGPALILER